MNFRRLRYGQVAFIFTAGSNGANLSQQVRVNQSVCFFISVSVIDLRHRTVFQGRHQFISMWSDIKGAVHLLRCVFALMLGLDMNDVG